MLTTDLMVVGSNLSWSTTKIKTPAPKSAGVFAFLALEVHRRDLALKHGRVAERDGSHFTAQCQAQVTSVIAKAWSKRHNIKHFRVKNIPSESISIPWIIQFTIKIVSLIWSIADDCLRDV